MKTTKLRQHPKIYGLSMIKRRIDFFKNILTGIVKATQNLLVSSVGVHTAAVHARVSPGVVTLVHVDVAVGAVEAWPTGAAVAVPKGGAGGAVAAGLARAVVRLLAGCPCKKCS